VPGRWPRVVAGVLVCVAPLRADDDVPGLDVRPAGHDRGEADPGIDLAEHVDLNVTLRGNEWRLGGSMQGLVIAGGGPLVIEGNLTIGGVPPQTPDERIRRTDEILVARLRQAQRDRLASVAANPRVPAADRRVLELATEADIRRVLADVARLRDRFAGRRAHLGDEDWREFQQEMRTCRRAIADPFGHGALFTDVWAGLAPDDGP
jgi:hypothetical protein